MSANRGLKDLPPAYLEGETLHRHSGARAAPVTTTDAYKRHLVFRAGQSSPRMDVSTRLLVLGVLIAPEIGGFVLVTALTVRNESDRGTRL